MAENHSFQIAAHYNIYTGNHRDKELRIDFSVPDYGVNSETGLLILVPGFGGNIDSNVYKKMREQFADTYNLVTIQCDYFGSNFMQTAESITIDNNQVFNKFFNSEEINMLSKDSSILLQLLQNKNIVFPVKAKMNENIEEFNDMGFMQAIDLITSIEAVQAILKDNGLSFNKNRIIGYGHSHGAYLLHLSNRLVPNLFSFIIDNSGWIEPVYLSSNRYLYQTIGKCTLAIEFDYLAKKIIKNKSILNMENFYRNYYGNTQILTFQGNDDNLINHHEKQRIMNNLNNTHFILVTADDVDHVKYKSNKHGLDADFLNLFSYALEIENKQQMDDIQWDYRIELGKTIIHVSNPYGLPVFQFEQLL